MDKNVEFSENEIQLAKDFNSKGYVVIDLGLSNSFIDDLNNEMELLSRSTNVKTNSSLKKFRVT